MHYLKPLVILGFGSWGLIGCNNRQPDTIVQSSRFKTEMMAAEAHFSELSETVGIRQALMECIDSNGVLLRPDIKPMVGGDAIDYITQSNDSTYRISWQTQGAEVATSGELGYTYGIFKLIPKGSDTVAQSGTYVNVWVRISDGIWKLSLNSGNQGIAE